eukprot:1648286-Rhodomonas_salina.1
MEDWFEATRPDGSPLVDFVFTSTRDPVQMACSAFRFDGRDSLPDNQTVLTFQFPVGWAVNPTLFCQCVLCDEPDSEDGAVSLKIDTRARWPASTERNSCWRAPPALGAAGGGAVARGRAVRQGWRAPRSLPPLRGASGLAALPPASRHAPRGRAAAAARAAPARAHGAGAAPARPRVQGGLAPAHAARLQARVPGRRQRAPAVPAPLRARPRRAPPRPRAARRAARARGPAA